MDCFRRFPAYRKAALRNFTLNGWHCGLSDASCVAPSSASLRANCWLSSAKGTWTGNLTVVAGNLGLIHSQYGEDKFMYENYFWNKVSRNGSS
jgi:hypothetical protein